MFNPLHEFVKLHRTPDLVKNDISTNDQVLESVQEDPPSSTVRHGRNMEMPLHFEELIQESCESSIKHYTDAYSSGSLSCEDDSLPDSHALLHVTSRRKPNTMVTDSLS